MQIETTLLHPHSKVRNYIMKSSIKKTISLFLCAAALCACTACGQSSTPITPTPDSSAPHVHAPTADWVCDFDNHWRVCECGEVLEKSAHTLEEVNCTVCGSELIVWEDGTKQVTAYNDYGDCCQFTYYDTDGSVLTDERMEYVYIADGKYTSMKAYNNGFLYSSYEYDLDSAGAIYMATQTSYFEDGSYQIDTYDENFNTLRTVYYDAIEKSETDHRYAYSEDGTRMTEQTYQDGTLTYEQELLWNNEYECFWDTIAERSYGEDGSLAYTYDDSGNPLSEIHYKPDGSLDVEYAYENTYDLSGDLIQIRTFTNGRLTQETEYINGTDPDGSTWSRSGKTTYYHEDGSKLVYDSDIESTWSTEITYDANGNVTHELRYEYLYNENGDSIGSRGYENGRLFTAYDSILDENGETIGVRNTDYREDGSKVVYEYDENFELLKEISYAADGSIISG